jgi:hypothetical protein
MFDFLTATKQQIFDHVVDHIFDQGGGSVGPSLSSTEMEVGLYAMEDGSSCSIGCLLPPLIKSILRTNPRANSKAVHELPLFLVGFSDTPMIRGYAEAMERQEYFLESIQDAHDDSFTSRRPPDLAMGWFRHKMRELAITFDLSPLRLEQAR